MDEDLIDDELIEADESEASADDEDYDSDEELVENDIDDDYVL